MVFVQTLTNFGTLTVNGQQGSDTALQERGYGGGGSGGSLWLATQGYAGNTNIFALGGRGGGVGQPNAGGAGGLGRIRFNLLNPAQPPSSQPAPGYIGNLSEMPRQIISDTDSDALPDFLEYQAGTNPLNPDTDGDGLPDGWEMQYGLNPLNPADAALQPPGDQLTYLQKYRFGLNPLTPDTDGDGMPDVWEVQYGLSPMLNDAALDRDLDGLTNLQEYQFNQTNVLGVILSPTSRLSGTNGLPDHENVTGRRNVSYFYDRNDRLTGAQYGNGLALLWQYDGNGNILRQLTATQDNSALPLVWRQLNSLTNSTGSQGDYGDADGDAWSNYQEWLAGSNPRDAASTPDTLGLPGTNIASLTLPFTPSNFVVGVGQLDGAGAEEIVVGADGNLGTNTNFLLILSQRFSGWTTQRVDVGPFGITSIAVGQATNRPSAGIYLGLRESGGTGRVAEVTLASTNWTVNTIGLSTNDAAFVLGLRSTNDLLVSLAATNAPAGTLFSLAYSASLTNWSLTSFDTNTSSRGLGTVGAIAPTDPLPTSIRLLDTGGIWLTRAASPFTMPETAATSRMNWRGHSLRSGFPRASFTNLASVAYTYLDDLNLNDQVDEGDEFVLAEYQLSGATNAIATLTKRRLQGSGARSYGLAFANYLNQTNSILFTGEPDGRVFAWQSRGATNPLQNQVFSAHHAGKAWHALAGVQIPQQGEGLIGLRVSAASPNSCDVIFWPPQIDLWKPANVPQTAPVTRIMPTPSSGGGFAPVNIRLWDGEGNASLLFLQYSNAASAGWSNALIASVNGAAYGFVSAPPSGNTHQVIWNANGLFAPGSTNTVWLRTRAQDPALLGEWSSPTLYQVVISSTPDNDGNGLPDAWEIQYFGGAGILPNADADGDGFKNWQEYMADTNPTSSLSYLRLTSAQPSPAGFVLQWQGGSQATQYLERAANLSTDAWHTIFTNQPPTPVSGSYTDALGTNLMRFYRIQAIR